MCWETLACGTKSMAKSLGMANFFFVSVHLITECRASAFLSFSEGIAAELSHSVRSRILAFRLNGGIF